MASSGIAPADTLVQYVESDAPQRERLFDSFLAALREMAREQGRESAREWALRAVGPTLSYSELTSLRKWVAPDGGESAAGAIRLAVLGGPTTTQLAQFLGSFLTAAKIPVHVHEGGYGLFRQEMLTPGSPLDTFQPNVVFVATGVRDVGRWPRLADDRRDVDALVEQEVADWARLWDISAQRWQATVIQNTFEVPPARAMGHYGMRVPGAPESYLARLNAAFSACAPSHVVLHDLNTLAAEAGAAAWFDPRFYFEAKLPCGPPCLVAYAHSVASLVTATRGKSKKVLVLDLDNTLWGDVVGDVGAGGIRLGQGLPDGEAFLAFQQHCKDLQQRGIVLAVCSKNDEEKAREPFERRADMALKLSDISCFVANWNNKADNLQAIARVLDLGLDSFVFVDDNPMERALVRRFLPAVAVPDMPDDPAGFITALQRHRYFEMTAFTAEDAARGRYYADDGSRRQLEAAAVDLDSFLASLDMRGRSEPVCELNVERATQLINKSNQFNLTTRRYTLAQVRDFAGNPGWRTLTVSLRDRVGDSGLIAVLLLRLEGTSLVIDTWVMSCRVLNRGVEAFCRNEIVEIAHGLGASELKGTYIPTPKNGLVQRHYERLGFVPDEGDGGTTHWLLTGLDRVTPLPTPVQREKSDG